MRRRDDVLAALRQRVIGGVRFGTLPPDGRLPSARALAGELDADARVVAAAFRALHGEGLVERRPPSRAYFAAASSGLGWPRQDPDATPRRDLHLPADGWLEGVFAQALERDLPLVALAGRVRRAVETVRLRAACIECNADHITWLCRELQEDYGIEASGVELEAATSALALLEPSGRPVPAPRATHAARLPAALREADVLVTTAAHAPVVERLAHAIGTRCIAVTIRDDLLRELARLLARAPVYFIGTDSRLADALRLHLPPGIATTHVRPVILGVDEIARIPDGAPSYVMRTARDQLGGVPQRLRVLSTLRAFSAETRAQLVHFIVRANLAAAAAIASR